MKGEIIVPSWKTLKKNGLIQPFRGADAIQKIKVLAYLNHNYPEEKEIIETLLRNWSSGRPLSQQEYADLRKSLKTKLRRFSLGGARIILEEEDDDNV